MNPFAWTVERLAAGKPVQPGVAARDDFGYVPLTPAEWQASQLTPGELERLMMPCEPLQW